MLGDLRGRYGAGVYRRNNRYQEGRRSFRFTYFYIFCAMYLKNSASSVIVLMLLGQGQHLWLLVLATKPSVRAIL
ncbi:unnamed protein product [Onchocerca flexuosa]|uniref:Uncharacterized protein n=1 Tax=Onchocerca flexuosa TaxID=387005 RepID=A0A183H956_9BILA|nr:unnamed protein product [Onchocerca flexuosa]